MKAYPIVLTRGPGERWSSEILSNTPSLPMLVKTGNGDIYEKTGQLWQEMPVYRRVPEVGFGASV